MSADFAELLGQAVTSTGAQYQAARDALVRAAEFEPDLRRVAATTEPWEDSWVARIALGWLEHADLFGRAAEFIEGKLPGPVPLSGTFSPDRRAQKLVELGPAVAPRLVEIAWKTREYPDDGRSGAVFAALESLALPDTFVPLRTLLGRETALPYRQGAIAVLGSTADSGATAGLRSIALDTSDPEEVRAAALDAYAKHQPDDLFDVAASVLRNATEPRELRITAAESLIQRHDPGTRALLHEVIQSTADTELLVTLVDGLAEHGDSSSVELLRALAARTTDEVLLDVIEETISALE